MNKKRKREKKGNRPIVIKESLSFFFLSLSFSLRQKRMESEWVLGCHIYQKIGDILNVRESAEPPSPHNIWRHYKTDGTESMENFQQ